jgi:nucleotide-binding universal stress UspA family protein
MAKRIVVAVDRTTRPYELLDLIGDLARAGAAVRLVHVAPPPTSTTYGDGDLVVYSDQEGLALRAEALDALRALEIHLSGEAVDSVVRFGDPADEIVREAEAFGADLIAMPAVCHHGVRRLLFGSVAERVARRAPMPVMLLRPAA